MNSFEINKIAGGVLGTLLLLQVVYLASNAIFSHPKAADTSAGREAAKPAADRRGPGRTTRQLYRQGDAKKGEDDSKACQTVPQSRQGGRCHPRAAALWRRRPAACLDSGFRRIPTR